MYVDQEYYFRNAKAKSHQTITRDLLVWNAILSVEQTSTPLNEKKRDIIEGINNNIIM